MQKVNGNISKRDFFNKSDVLTDNYWKLLVEIGCKKSMMKDEKEIFYNKYKQEFLIENPEFDFPCVHCKKLVVGSRS